MSEETKGSSLSPMGDAGSKLSLLEKFGARYSVEPKKVYDTLCKTAFADATSQEQVIALLVVADQYGLNPFTKEIFAFPDKKGGVVPVVGIDGWNRIAQQHAQFDGMGLRYSEETTTPDSGKECPEWIEAVIYRKDRQHPIIVREYLDECYRGPIKGFSGPWQSHTKRMLRHKALIQGYRIAFGFHGIYDPDEAEGFIDISPIIPEAGRVTRSGPVAALQEASKPKARAKTPTAPAKPADTENGQKDGEGVQDDLTEPRIDPATDKDESDLGI